MKHVTLGTTGHIDHGKTSLVRSITGTDTDRLIEEKERGITIDLGFAHTILPSGIDLSIVDVPGHERFVKNMVAGASSIDMVMLVISADDGIMPQTREHLDICTLLGLRRGVVAITKTDVVDTEWLQIVMDDVRSYLKGTFLEDAPIVPVSSVTLDGIADLIRAIDDVAAKVDRAEAHGIFRMHVDRSFPIKGFGTVVTGTVVSGKVNIGDEMEVLPRGVTAKVRGIQCHGSLVESGTTGSRAAINLQGIQWEEIRRGDTLVSPGKLSISNTIEASISILPSSMIVVKDGMELMLHIGTTAVAAKLLLLNAKTFRPGQQGIGRIKLKNHVVAMHGDRFVLRCSDARTVGGGVVLDAAAPRRGRTVAVEELKILAGADPAARVLVHIRRSGIKGVTQAELELRLNIWGKDLDDVVSELITKGDVLQTNGILIASDSVKDIEQSILSILQDFHRREPIKPGVTKEEIRTRLDISSSVLSLTIGRLEKERNIAVTGDVIRLSTHNPAAGEMRERILKTYMDAGLTPPTLKELQDMTRMTEKEALDLLHLQAKEGRLVKVKDLFFAKDDIDRLQIKIQDFFKAKNEMTPVDFKEMTGLSRKFAIPLLEYMDAQKITIRVGEARRLRKG